MLLFWLSLAGGALSQNAPNGTPINCTSYRLFTISESWTTISLGNSDIVIIEVLGAIAQGGLLLVLCTFLFIKESREPPGEIFAFLSFFNFLGITSQMASAIYVQRHGSYESPPESWDQFCFGTGIVNILGIIGVNVYNILFCVYVWVSIRTTLKPAEQNFLPYHLFCLGTIALAAVLFYVTGNVGVSANGICSYKMNPVTPFVFLFFFAFYLFVAVNTLRSFKKYVPKIRILRIYRREFIVFFNLYLTINSLLTLTSSLMIIAFEEICQAEGMFSPGLLGTFINTIEILQGIVVVYVRLRHPLIKSHVSRLADQLLGRRSDQKHTLHTLRQSIRLYNIYNFLSAARISYRLAPSVPDAVNFHHSVRLEDSAMRVYLGSHSVYEDFEMPPLEVKFFCCGFLKKGNAGLVDPFESLAVESNRSALELCSTTDGGKSGQFFFISEDKNYILKTTKKEEVEVFLRRASQFINYFTHTNPNSLILRFSALYEISYESVDCSVAMLLMPNLKRFAGMEVLRTFDLKGSKYKREVLAQHDLEQARTRTLKDTDFHNYERKIYVKKSHMEGLQRTLEADASFLASLGLMDYSLLVVKASGPMPSLQGSIFTAVPSTREKGVYYVFGVIDYLQVWNLKKMGELQAKKVLIQQKEDVNAEDISAQEPQFYRERFLNNLVYAVFSCEDEP